MQLTLTLAHHKIEFKCFKKIAMLSFLLYNNNKVIRQYNCGK